MNPQHPATRREFLTGGIGLIGFGATVPTFLARTLYAITQENDGSRVASRPGAVEERVLVVVHWAGGNDGLNTLIPYRNDAYYRARPKLAIATEKVRRIDDVFGFHPEAAGLQKLWDAGRMGVVHGVGYPNPNRSHFVSTRIWHTASPDGSRADGWIGRYFDNCCAGTDPPPLSGVVIDEEVPLALRGKRFSPICTSKPESFGAPRGRRGGRPATSSLPDRATGSGQNAATGSSAGQPTDTDRDSSPARKPKRESTIEFLHRSALDAALSAEQLRTAANRAITGVEFPQNEVGRQLQSVAHMIAAGLKTKVYYVSLGGFDTHANQLDRHARVLREASSALAAFVDALAHTGDLSRTLVMTFSEFGRRVSENASGGTDHGQAAPLFLLGDTVRPGHHGSMPSLERLSLGDQVFNTDFRQVYATVLRDWLGTKPEAILQGPTGSLPLLRT